MQWGICSDLETTDGETDMETADNLTVDADGNNLYNGIMITKAGMDPESWRVKTCKYRARKSCVP